MKTTKFWQNKSGDFKSIFEVIDTNDETYFKISVCQLISDLKRGHPKLEIHLEENLLAL